MNRVVERFGRVLRDQPDRPLVHLPLAGRSVTSAHLWEASTHQRSRLEQLGLGPDHLLIYAAGNRVDLLALWLACGRLGVSLMPVDAGSSLAEIGALATQFGATAIVLADSLPIPPGLGRASLYVQGLNVVTPRAASPAPGMYSGAAVLKLTSGSTGLPKATSTTDEQLVNDADHITTAMDIRATDCQLAAIPLSHSYGIGNLVLPLLLQGTPMVLRETFVPHQFRADAHTYGIRIFPGVPFMFEHFSAHLSPGAWPTGTGLLISAGARLERESSRAFFGSFGLKIHSFYGTSETGGISYDDSHDIEDEATVGRALPGVSLSLRPEDGVPETGGRVHVSGNAVASGYAGGEPFESGDAGEGFLTADVGRFTHREQLVLTGRVSSFINVAGRKVQPEEVESVLRAIPGIRDARVIGAPDAARGEHIVACLVAQGVPPGTLAVRQFCAARLAPHKIPRTIVMLDRVPLTERGKTDHRRLREAVEAHLRKDSGTGVL